MIHITYHREEGRIHITGHAGYAEAGKDIVCAAISALYETLALHELTLSGYDKAQDIRFVRAIPPAVTVMQPILDAFAAGMKQIAKQYPEHVKVYRE